MGWHFRPKIEQFTSYEKNSINSLLLRVLGTSSAIFLESCPFKYRMFRNNWSIGYDFLYLNAISFFLISCVCKTFEQWFGNTLWNNGNAWIAKTMFEQWINGCNASICSSFICRNLPTKAIGRITIELWKCVGIKIKRHDHLRPWLQ